MYGVSLLPSSFYVVSRTYIIDIYQLYRIRFSPYPTPLLIILYRMWMWLTECVKLENNVILEYGEEEGGGVCEYAIELWKQSLIKFINGIPRILLQRN